MTSADAISELLTDIKQESIDLRTDVKGLSDQVELLATRLKWSRRITATLSVFVTLVTIATVGVVIIGYRAHVNFDCIRKWSNATSQRNEALSGPANIRTTAEDKLFKDAGAKPPDQKLIAEDYAAYKVAAGAFHAAVAANPVPVSYNCGSF